MKKKEQETPALEASAGIALETTTVTVEETTPQIEPGIAPETTTVTVEETTPQVEPAVETETTTVTVEGTSTQVESSPLFEYNGKSYTLADYVVKLQVNGRIYLRAEILTNNEIMTSLIIGNSPFVKKA